MLHLILACLPFFFIGPFWKDIWGDLGDAAGNIAHTLKTWLEQVANNVWDSIHNLASSVGDAGNWISHNIWDRLGDLGQTIYNGSKDLKDGLIDTLRDFAGTLQDAAKAVKDGLIDTLRDFAGTLQDAAKAVKDGLIDTLRDFAGTLQDAAKAVKDGLIDTLRDFAGTIQDAVGGLADKIWDRLGDLLGGVQDAAGKVEALPEAAVKAAIDNKERFMESFLLGGPNPLSLSLPAMIERWGPDVVSRIRIQGKPIEQWAGDTFDDILKLMTGTGRIEPEDAPDVIARALGVATAFGVAARVPGLAQGFVPFESPDATADLAGFLSKFAAWDPIIEAGLGTAVSLALRRPMDSLLNKRSLSNEPRTSDASALFSRRFIDAATHDETMHRDGFPDDWGVPFREAAYRPLRKFELSMLAAAVDLPDNVLTTFLERAGYPPEVIPILADGLHATTLKTATSARLTQARAAFANGFMDLSTFHAIMDDLGLTPAEQDLWVLAAQLDYSNGVKTELLAAYRSAAGRDALSDDELRAACAQLGLTSDKIEVEVARAQVARLKKPVDKTAVEQQAAVNKARATMTEAYLLQYKKGALDEQTLLAALSFIGVPDVQANACVALAKAQSLTAPTSVPVDTPEMVNRRTLKDLQDAYVLQFQHDLLDADQLRAALIGAEMAPSEADAITLREQARKTPSPVVANKRTEERVTMEAQDALASAYVNQYQQGFIDADALESNLVSIGLDPRVAQSRRLLEESKAYGLSTKARQTTEDQAADQLQRAEQTATVESFRKGLIDADRLETHLIEIGLTPDLAGAVRDYEEIHALPGPPATPTPAQAQAARDLQRAQQRVAVEAYRKGLVDGDALQSALEGLGLARDLAAAITAYEEIHALPTPKATTTPA